MTPSERRDRNNRSSHLNKTEAWQTCKLTRLPSNQVESPFCHLGECQWPSSQAEAQNTLAEENKINLQNSRGGGDKNKNLRKNPRFKGRARKLLDLPETQGLSVLLAQSVVSVQFQPLKPMDPAPLCLPSRPLPGLCSTNSTRTQQKATKSQRKQGFRGGRHQPGADARPPSLPSRRLGG